MAITRLNNNSVTSVSALPNLASLPSGIDTGKLVQHTTSQGSSSGSSQSTSYVATGIKHSITPTSSSNKILVLMNFNVWTQGHTGSYYWVKSNARIVRSITGGSSSNVLTGRQVNGSSGATVPVYTYGYSMGQYSLNYLDSPSTTSEVEYELHLQFSELQSTNGTHYWNGFKNVTLMELVP